MLQVNTKVASRRGLEWFNEAWVLFKKAPGPFVLWTIFVILGSYVSGMAPKFSLILRYVFSLLTTYGGYQIIANLEKSGRFEWSQMVIPIKSKFFKMVTFSIIALVPYIIGLMAFLIISSLFVTVNFDELKIAFINTSSDNPMQGLISLFSLITKEIIFVFIPTFTATMYVALGIGVFGASIITFTDESPLTAAKLSFKAMSTNLGSLTVAGLIGFMLLIFAFIPFGLGLLIYYPLTLLVTYKAYCDIFGTPAMSKADSVETPSLNSQI